MGSKVILEWSYEFDVHQYLRILVLYSLLLREHELNFGKIYHSHLVLFIKVDRLEEIL